MPHALWPISYALWPISYAQWLACGLEVMKRLRQEANGNAARDAHLQAMGPGAHPQGLGYGVWGMGYMGHGAWGTG